MGASMTSIKTVGVVGAGIMGSGIAQIVAQGGYAVVVREAEQRLLEKGKQAIDGRLQRTVEKGRMTAEEKTTLLGRIRWTLALEDLKATDLIIAATTEDLPPKQDLFHALDRLCPPSTIFVSNTSSISIVALASVTERDRKSVV